MKRIILLVSSLLMAINLWSQVSISIVALQEGMTGDSIDLVLSVNNTKSIKALQCDITLPSAISFNQIEPILSNKAISFDLDYRYISDKQVRILISSGTNAIIEPDSTAMVRFSVNVPIVEKPEIHQIQMTNTKVIFEEYQNLMIADQNTPTFEVKPSFVIRYYDGDQLVYKDTIKQDQLITAPDIKLQKEGFTFVGWDNLPDLMPKYDINIYASYEKNTYRLVYMVDNEIYHIDSIVYADNIYPIDSPSKEGHTFSGWQHVPKIMPAKDDTISGYFSVNTYQITYLLDGQIYYIDSVMYDSDINAPIVAEKEGYSFSGWNNLPSFMPAHDIFTYSSYNINSYRLVYLVDDKDYFTDSIIYANNVYPIDFPIKEGHTFSGWQNVPNVMPAKDDTISGYFSVNTYQIIYMIDEQVYYTDSIVYGYVINAPNAIEKEGYTFENWKDLPIYMPANDLNINATYNLNANQVDKNGLAYRKTESKDAFEVFAYTDTIKSDVIIPTEIYGLPVNAIAPKALEGAINLKSIEIPESVKQVGDNAFAGCHNLLVVEWKSPIEVDANYFDEAEKYGNMLVFSQNGGDFAGNMVVNGNADYIMLIDGKNFRNPKVFNANKITYSRNFKKKSNPNESAGWEAMVLPFDVHSITTEDNRLLTPFEWADFKNTFPMWLSKWLVSIGTFATSNSIEANVPFIVRVPNSDEYQPQYNVSGVIEFSATNTEVKPTIINIGVPTESEYILTATYDSIMSSPENYVLNEENYITAENSTIAPGGAFVSSLRTVRPFEAYIKKINSDEDNSQVPHHSYLRIGKDNTIVSSHKTILEENQNDEWYNLQGQRMLKTPLQSGLYIHNGKKVYIKRSY